MLQRRPKLGSSPVDAATHGSQLDAERLGDLLVREALDVTQDHSSPEVGRHVVERALHVVVEMFCLVNLGRRRLTAGQAVAAADAGAQFVVSPGLHVEVVHVCRDLGVLAIPGVGTATEYMAARRLGLDVLKVFPAEPLGGPPFVRALASLEPGVRFLPTGGIDRDRAADYLALPQVLAVGGSWMATAEHVAAGDWAAVERAAADCRVVGRDPADR